MSSRKTMSEIVEDVTGHLMYQDYNLVSRYFCWEYEDGFVEIEDARTIQFRFPVTGAVALHGWIGLDDFDVVRRVEINKVGCH